MKKVFLLIKLNFVRLVLRIQSVDYPLFHISESFFHCLGQRLAYKTVEISSTFKYKHRPIQGTTATEMRLCEYLDAGDEKWKVVGKKATEKKTISRFKLCT